MQRAADLGRGDTLEQRHRQHLVPEPFEQLEVATALAPEPEVGAGDDHRRVDQLLGRELLRLQLGDVERELDHRRLGDAELGQQLEPALERRQRLDEVAEDDARMRLERQHPDGQPGAERGLDHAAMPEVDPVERPDRDREPLLGRAHGSSASACSAGITRSSSASSTLNGPTSSRRSATQ